MFDQIKITNINHSSLGNFGIFRGALPDRNLDSVGCWVESFVEIQKPTESKALFSFSKTAAILAPSSMALS